MKDYSRVISNQVRFGYGYRIINNRKSYYAWHGVPNRNDDYITISKISKKEFDQIEKEYPNELIANREEAAIFESKYILGHKILGEGWNISIYNIK